MRVLDGACVSHATYFGTLGHDTVPDIVRTPCRVAQGKGHRFANRLFAGIEALQQRQKFHADLEWVHGCSLLVSVALDEVV